MSKIWLFHKNKIIIAAIGVIVVIAATAFLLTRGGDSVVDSTSPLQTGNQTQEPEPGAFDMTREDFLEDVDYMLAIIEANSPYFELIYSQLGVDMIEAGEELRSHIESGTGRITVNNLLHLLNNLYFGAAEWAGGLQFFNPGNMWWMQEVWLPYMQQNSNTAHLAASFEQLLGGPMYTQWWTVDSRGIAELETQNRPEHNIETEILQDSIAVISLMTIPAALTTYDRATLDDLFAQLDSLQHVIIDLRDVWGSFPSYFYNYIKSPLADGDVHMWILTNDGTQGAPIYIAADAHITGFATLVGDYTGRGAYLPYGKSFILLPNSGFIVTYRNEITTDANGNPLSLGVAPHYHNFDGMDALETTLALINN